MMIGLAAPCVLNAQETERTREQQDLDFADGLYQRGMYETAARHYLEFIRAHPESALQETAFFRRGESLYRQAAAIASTEAPRTQLIMREARQAFMDMVKSYPSGERIYDALLRLGELNYKTGDPESGLEPLRRVRAESRDEGLVEAAVFYAARCAESLGDTEKATADYRLIREKYPEGEYAALSTFLLADLLDQEGRNDEALLLLDEIWRTNRFSIAVDSGLAGDAQLRTAQILYQAERYAEAAELYLDFADAHPEGPRTSRARYGAAWARFQQQQFAEALDIARVLQRRFLSTDLVPGIVYLQGACSYQERFYDDAIRYFREVIADPLAGEYRQKAWYQLAWSYFLSENFEQASIECRNLLRIGISPSLASNVHFLLGQTFAQTDQYGMAVEEFKRVEAIDPQGEFVQEAAYLTGDMLFRANRYAESAEVFERYFDTYSNSPQAREALTWAVNALFADRDYPDAIRVAEKLLQAYPEHPERIETLYRIALAHYQLQDYDDALKAMERLIALGDEHPRRPDALYWTAYILELRDQRDEAASAYGMLLERYPNFANRDEVVLRKAFCEYRMDRLDEAYLGFLEALGSSARNQIPPGIGFWMIVHADEAERHEEALEIADALLDLFSDRETQERARLARSNQFVALKRWEEARASARQFVDQYPETLFKPEIFWVMAKALEGLEREEEALLWFEESIIELQRMANPDPQLEAAIYVDLGRAKENQGQYKEALDAYLRVAILYDHPRLTPEAMYRAIRCHLELDEQLEAAAMYNELTQDFADSSWSALAREHFHEAIHASNAVSATPADTSTLQ